MRDTSLFRSILVNWPLTMSDILLRYPTYTETFGKHIVSEQALEQVVHLGRQFRLPISLVGTCFHLRWP